MDGSQRINPYLAGNFAPIATEDDFALEIIGEIPRELRGAFYRNGPNPQFPPRGEHHWFFGDGMIHAFFVENGKATYRNRYVHTPKFELERSAGKALFGLFGSPMDTDPSALWKDSAVANTNIVHHAGKLMALEEGHKPTELDARTLETKAYLEPYGGAVTAHPKLDPKTGEMVWFAYISETAPLGNVMAYGVTDASGKVLRRDAFQAPYASMVHDFLVTEGHVMFPVLPLTGSLERAMRGLPPYGWEPEKGAFVGVMARDASVDSIRWFEVEPNYVFHPMNAWEEGSTLYADVMQYPVAPLFPNADGTPGQRTFATLKRWTIDLAGDSNTVKVEDIDDTPGEFPRFDERFALSAYRHGWFASALGRPGGMTFDSLVHVDLKTGKRQIHRLNAGDGVGEPVFVPRHPGSDEGDGYIVALAHNGAEDKAEFLVFEAQDLEGGPIGRARVPRRIPYGFHGNWVGA